MQEGVNLVPHKKSLVQMAKYYKMLKAYEENCRIGNGTYSEFAKCVGANLNLMMPSLRGWHR